MEENGHTVPGQDVGTPRTPDGTAELTGDRPVEQSGAHPAPEAPVNWGTATVTGAPATRTRPGPGHLSRWTRRPPRQTARPTTPPT